MRPEHDTVTAVVVESSIRLECGLNSLDGPLPHKAFNWEMNRDSGGYHMAVPAEKTSKTYTTVTMKTDVIRLQSQGFRGKVYVATESYTNRGYDRWVLTNSGIRHSETKMLHWELEDVTEVVIAWGDDDDE